MSLKVGLILYSVRDEMAKDPFATVKKVGQLGYKFIETFNSDAINDSGCGFGIPAHQLKDTLNQFGSQVVSAHVLPLSLANISAIIVYNKILGNQNIVNPAGFFSTYDELMQQCEEFNRIGRILREEGMTFLYHNHDIECRTIQGKMVIDYLVENTDPNYMSFELDTFWIMRGGLNPVDMLKRVGKRVKLIHQKDFAWDSLQAINLIGLSPEERELKPGMIIGTSGNSIYAYNEEINNCSEEEWEIEFARLRDTSYTEIGCGIMPIQDIIDATNEYTDAEYIILEQDATRMPTQIESIKKSLEGFLKYEGILWE